MNSCYNFCKKYLTYLYFFILYFKLIFKKSLNDILNSGLSEDGITRFSLIIFNNNGVIENISIKSDKTAYPSGDGFNLGPAFGCKLNNCSVFKVGGTSFVIGDNTANSFTNYLYNCYSNNPGGDNYQIKSEWFIGDRLVADGGAAGRWEQPAG